MENTTTIAFVTDDGQTISSHFGRARFYEVVTLRDNAVISRERRPKAGHHTFAPETAHDPGQHDAKHTTMVSPVLDCSMLVARGMGAGAHTHLLSAGITPILTDLQTIDQAVAAFVEGSLKNDVSRLHDHGHHH